MGARASGVESIGVESESLDLAEIALWRELLSVEQNIQRTDISSLEDDLAVSLDGLLRRRRKDLLYHRLAVGNDGDPGILAGFNLHQKGTRN